MDSLYSWQDSIDEEPLYYEAQFIIERHLLPARSQMLARVPSLCRSPALAMETGHSAVHMACIARTCGRCCTTSIHGWRGRKSGSAKH